MRVLVDRTRGTTCFVELPQCVVSAHLGVEAARGVWPVAVRLAWRGSGASGAELVAYVGWNGAVAASATAMGVPAALAECLRLEPGAGGVDVRPAPRCALAARLEVEPLSPDDWDLIELGADHLEATMLAQVAVVFVGQELPLRLAPAAAAAGGGGGPAPIARVRVVGAAVAGGGDADCFSLARARTSVCVVPKVRAAPAAAAAAVAPPAVAGGAADLGAVPRLDGGLRLRVAPCLRAAAVLGECLPASTAVLGSPGQRGGGASASARSALAELRAAARVAQGQRGPALAVHPATLAALRGGSCAPGDGCVVLVRAAGAAAGDARGGGDAGGGGGGGAAAATSRTPAPDADGDGGEAWAAAGAPGPGRAGAGRLHAAVACASWAVMPGDAVLSRPLSRLVGAAPFDFVCVCAAPSVPAPPPSPAAAAGAQAPSPPPPPTPGALRVRQVVSSEAREPPWRRVPAPALARAVASWVVTSDGAAVLEPGAMFTVAVPWADVGCGGRGAPPRADVFGLPPLLDAAARREWAAGAGGAGRGGGDDGAPALSDGGAPPDGAGAPREAACGGTSECAGSADGGGGGGGGGDAADGTAECISGSAVPGGDGPPVHVLVDVVYVGDGGAAGAGGASGSAPPAWFIVRRALGDRVAVGAPLTEAPRGPAAAPSAADAAGGEGAPPVLPFLAAAARAGAARVRWALGGARGGGGGARCGGVLISGAAGCGKTATALHLAGLARAAFGAAAVRLDCAALRGARMAAVRAALADAWAAAAAAAPAVLIVDDAHHVMPPPSGSPHEARGDAQAAAIVEAFGGAWAAAEAAAADAAAAAAAALPEAAAAAWGAHEAAAPRLAADMVGAARARASVVVIVCANDAVGVHPALRRLGLLDCVVPLRKPVAGERAALLGAMVEARGARVEGGVDWVRAAGAGAAGPCARWGGGGISWP